LRVEIQAGEDFWSLCVTKRSTSDVTVDAILCLSGACLEKNDKTWQVLGSFKCTIYKQMYGA